MEELCFIQVNFPNDANVADRLYWYLCLYDDAKEGDRVLAPLGRHDRLQTGVVHKVVYAHDYDAPYPLYLIKAVKKRVETGE